MGFIAPFVPAIASGIGALFGSKAAKKASGPTPAQSQVLAQDAEAQKMGIATGKSLLPQAQNLLTQGANTQQPVLNYWSSILSGNRGQATSAMAPEISRIGQGYQAATNASSSLMPRGGTSTEFNAELPFQQQRDTSGILQGARPAAASSLFTAGSQISGQGSTLLNNAIASIYGSTAAGRDILASEEARKKAEQERSTSFGKNLFGLINTYGPDIAKKVAGLFAGGVGKSTGANEIPSSPVGQV